MTGTFGLVNATSFYPTKLGALGEAVFIATNSKDMMEFCMTYRNYGSKKNM